MVKLGVNNLAGEQCAGINVLHIITLKKARLEKHCGPKVIDLCRFDFGYIQSRSLVILGVQIFFQFSSPDDSGDALADSFLDFFVLVINGLFLFFFALAEFSLLSPECVKGTPCEFLLVGRSLGNLIGNHFQQCLILLCLIELGLVVRDTLIGFGLILTVDVHWLFATFLPTLGWLGASPLSHQLICIYLSDHDWSKRYSRRKQSCPTTPRLISIRCQGICLFSTQPMSSSVLVLMAWEECPTF